MRNQSSIVRWCGRRWIISPLEDWPEAGVTPESIYEELWNSRGPLTAIGVEDYLEGDFDEEDAERCEQDPDDPDDPERFEFFESANDDNDTRIPCEDAGREGYLTWSTGRSSSCIENLSSPAGGKAYLLQ